MTRIGLVIGGWTVSKVDIGSNGTYVEITNQDGRIKGARFKSTFPIDRIGSDIEKHLRHIEEYQGE